MSTETTTEADEPEKPAVAVDYMAVGKTLLYRIGGARLTTDVGFVDQRVVWPRVDRAWKFGMLIGMIVALYWLHGIAVDVHAISLTGGTK